MATPNIYQILELQAKKLELEIALKDAQRYKTAVEAAGFDIWENNLVNGETYGTNRQLFLNLGYVEDELPKTTEETFSKIHPEDLEKALQKIQEHVVGKSDRYTAEMRVKAKDGSWVWTGNYGKILERDENNGVTRIVGLSFDIDQRRIMEETMKELAYTDALTGLGNRRLLMEAGNYEIERGLRYNHSISLLLIDLDNYKLINDTYGHIVGDEVLVQFAHCLKNILRDTDIKVRYGGDEFVILLIESDQQAAVDTAQRLQEAVKAENFGIRESLTISVGQTTLKPNDTLIEMLQRSDRALFEAKKLGKNITVIK